MKPFAAIIIALLLSPLILAQDTAADRQRTKELQKQIRAEEQRQKKERKAREKAAKNLRPTATVNAEAKKIRALLVQEMNFLGWTLAASDDLTVSFIRPSPGKRFGHNIGAAIAGGSQAEYVNDLARFTLLELEKVITVTVDSGTVTGTRFKETSDLGPSSDGAFNLEMQDLLDRIKMACEGFVHHQPPE